MMPDLDIEDEIQGARHMMTAGTGGFSGSAAATGVAGFDPMLDFRKKMHVGSGIILMQEYKAACRQRRR